MRLIEVDRLFWFLDADPGLENVEDPFSGLDAKARSELHAPLRAFERWVQDQRLTLSIAESKAVGTVAHEPFSRDKRYASITKRPSYAREMSYQLSSANKMSRNVQAEAKRELLRLTREFAEGAYSASQYQRISVQLLRTYYERIFNAGRKASGLMKFMPGDTMPTQWETSWFRGAVRQEIGFWNNFVFDLEQGNVQFAPKVLTALPRPPRRPYFVEERIGMFVKSMESMFDSSRVTGLPSAVLVYWSGPGIKDKRICEGCAYIVERHPFPKELVPAVPRAGMTPCRTNCRHRLLVRKASAKMIAARKRVLPKRVSMVNALEAIMTKRRGGRRGRLRRPRGAVTNPWG